MKKLSLKTIKESLNRDEMRRIRGGCGDGYKKCKRCSVNSDCPGSTCATGIPYCSDGLKRCL